MKPAAPEKPRDSSGNAEDTSASVGGAALSAFFDCSPVPTFAIDANHVLTHWNKACERMIGTPAAKMIGTRDQWKMLYPQERPVLADLIVSAAGEEAIKAYYQDKVSPSPLMPGAYEGEDFFPKLGEHGRWLAFCAAPLRDAAGRIVGAIETLQDVTTRKVAEQNLHNTQMELEQLISMRTMQLARANTQLMEDLQKQEAAEAELRARNAELTELNEELSKAQEQLVQADKLASIGQLAAGVAHEINNPMGYIASNFGALENYLASLFEMVAAYEDSEHAIGSPEIRAQILALRKGVELDFLKEDIPALMHESKEGILRVKNIVQDLKDFSRIDAHQEWQWANLHQGINSTLNIVSNEVKYKADVVKEYGELPDVECLPTQINQVIMNLVVNAAHAMKADRGTITIRTGCTGSDAEHGEVWIEVADNGSGISKENLPRIFDPFFTTKPVGKGTGLGLSLSYGIMKKHHGRIEVDSKIGEGTVFRITLPVSQPSVNKSSQT